jgi:electron transfer flavoprotein alpha subunit
LLIAGAEVTQVAEKAAGIPCLRQVLCAQAPYYARPGAENLTALLQSLAAHYAYVIVAATVRGKAILPRLGALLDVAPVSDVMRIVNDDTFERLTHAGNVQQRVQSAAPVKLLSIRASAFRPVRDSQPPAPIVAIDAAADLGLSRVEARTVSSGRDGLPALSRARVVVCGGKGFESADDFYALLTPLAETLGAALGATRVLVEAGVHNKLQIGQSGVAVAPDLYLALGLSGAVQHVAGIRNSRCIVAINRDPQAPIFAYADYGLLGDVYSVVPQLTQALRPFTSRRGECMAGVGIRPSP